MALDHSGFGAGLDLWRQHAIETPGIIGGRRIDEPKLVGNEARRGPQGNPLDEVGGSLDFIDETVCSSEVDREWAARRRSGTKQWLEGCIESQYAATRHARGVGSHGAEKVC